MLSAISRMDHIIGSVDHRWFVASQLESLFKNDTWCGLRSSAFLTTRALTAHDRYLYGSSADALMYVLVFEIISSTSTENIVRMLWLVWMLIEPTITILGYPKLNSCGQACSRFKFRLMEAMIFVHNMTVALHITQVSTMAKMKP
jgi:hypothetical protein